MPAPGLIIFLLVRRWTKKESSRLAANDSAVWEIPWDWETVWQVFVVGFLTVGQILVPLLVASFFPVDTSSLSSEGQAVYVLVTYLLLAGGGLAVLYLSVRPFLPLPAGWFELRGRGNWLLWGIGGYFVAFPLTIAVSLVNQQFWQGQGGSNPILQIALENDSGIALLVFVLTASIAAPLYEEILFRGFILPSLTRYVSVPAAIAISSILFALAHLNLSEVAPLATLGAVLGTVYTRSRGLLAPILLARALERRNFGKPLCFRQRCELRRSPASPLAERAKKICKIEKPIYNPRKNFSMHVPDAIRTRELNFLEIFWEGLTLFQQHLPTIAIVTLAVNLPFHIALPFLPGFIFHLLAGRGLGEVLGSVASDEAASISLFDELEYLLPPLAIALAVTAIAFGLVQSLSHAAVCLTVERSLYGEFLDGVQALKLAIERLLATFWTNLLVLVALKFLVAIAFGSVMGVFTGTNVSYFLYFRHIETFGNIQQDPDIPMGKIQTIFAASILAWVLLLVVGMFVSYAFSACVAALRPGCGQPCH